MTELQVLKKKKKDGKATAEDLVRLKQLQDGEPLSAADLEVAKQREADREAKDKADFAAKQAAKVHAMQAEQPVTPQPATKLDIPADHPRIAAIKQALMPFTQIECHSSRQDEFILFTRGISITAGDVRKACEAMKL